MGVFVDDGVVSLIFLGKFLLRAVYVGFLDENHWHEGGVLVGVFDGFVVCGERFVGAVEVYEAVTF